MLRASQRKASFYRPTIPTNQPEPIQHSSSSPTLPPPAANHFVQETSLIGSAMRKVLSIVGRSFLAALLRIVPTRRDLQQLEYPAHVETPRRHPD
jgi:hypothetical protein